MQNLLWSPVPVNVYILGLSKVLSVYQTLHTYIRYESVVFHQGLQLFSQYQKYHSLCGTTSTPLYNPGNCFKNRELLGWTAYEGPREEQQMHFDNSWQAKCLTALKEWGYKLCCQLVSRAHYWQPNIAREQGSSLPSGHRMEGRRW